MNNIPNLQWFKTKTEGEKTFVFDPLRKRYCILSPEEEVRQKALYLLVEHLGVPSGLLAVEYSIKVNNLDKRCDAVVFGKDARPLMIVECKASTVKITEKVLDQAIRYFSALRPKYLLLYNGLNCYCFLVDANNLSLRQTDHLPSYEEMMGQ